MARSNIATLLPLDRYADIMAIHPDAFNQCYFPASPYTSECPHVWLQKGWLDTTGKRIVGRRDVARAIATAEKKISEALGFWVAPTWTINEEHDWILPKRGVQIEFPPIELRWGNVIAGGERGLRLVTADNAVILSDEDGDGVNETATVTVAAAAIAAASATLGELEIFVPDETADTERIRWLSRSLDAATGNAIFVGRTSQFTKSALWLTGADVDLTVAANFYDKVDVYRRYNDPSDPAKIVFKGGTADLCYGTTVCAETCQDACVVVDKPRVGNVRTIPASYAAGTWTLMSFSLNRYPDAVRVSYQSGLALDPYTYEIDEDLAEAIVRLANCYLVDEPCGCDMTRQRFKRDREMKSMTDFDAALATRFFGTSCRGAAFATMVVEKLGPVGKGGRAFA